jgi:hypothetical protein
MCFGLMAQSHCVDFSGALSSLTTGTAKENSVERDQTGRKLSVGEWGGAQFFGIYVLYSTL